MIKFTFSGKAREPSKDWNEGFKDGHDFALKTFDANMGIHNKPYPSNFVHRVGDYNRGFGEGLITGRHKVISDTFPKHRSISWDDHGANVTY